MSEQCNYFPKYHKIQSIYERDMGKKHKPFIIGEFTCPEFEYLQHNEWEFTEKVDGTNVRVFWDGVDFKFGGRTDNAQMPMRLLDILGCMFNKKAFINVFGEKRVTIYGEGFGGRIQSGGKYSQTETFAVFDILIDGWWLRTGNIANLCNQLNLPAIPYLGVGSLYDAIDRVKVGSQSEYGDFEAEGIVAKPMFGLKARNGSRIITKIKYKDFEGL